MLGTMQKLEFDDTPHSVSLAGLILGGPRTQIFAKLVAHNSTVKTLDMSRKGIEDKEGQDLGRMLLSNKVLRKLELEGNVLGLQTARAFAKVFRTNKTLKYINLESNNLSHDGEENGRVEDMISALATNQTLLGLNLNNNRLDEGLGRQFVDCLHQNHTLIDFEFDQNNFRIEDVRRL